MPLYDFECPHSHRFERQCLIADRLAPVPCEGMVNQLASNEEHRTFLSTPVDERKNGVGGLMCVPLDEDDPHGEKIVVKKVPCVLDAKLIVGTHSNPGALLDHGSASNRDAAREGRYDPLNPNRRFMAKGRGWRK